MKAFITRIAVACALALVAANAWGQGTVAAVVEFSSGDDIVVIRGGRRVTVQETLGLELYQGDQVQTGKGVFVELRLSSGGAVVKLAENTTFVLERMTDGQASLQLVYGRIRAKVERLAGTDTFSVRSSQAVAGVRGTDFGVDVVVSRAASTSTTTSAYCFEGSVEVTAFVRSDAQAAESLEAIPKAYTIGAGEMVKVEGSAGTAEATKSVVEEAIREFWRTNDYVLDIPPAAVASPGAAGATEPPIRDDLLQEGYDRGFEEAKALFDRGPDYVPAGYVSQKELDSLKRVSKLQKISAASGGLASLTGAAFATYGFIQIDSGDAAGGEASLKTGAIISAVSLPLLFLSIFAKP